MKRLDNLIRLQQWRLDEKRRKVIELERLIVRLRSEVDQLEKSLKIEQQLAARNTEAATGHGSYASPLIARHEKLRVSLAGLESELVQATDDVAVASQELRKFDLIKKRNDQNAKLHRKRVQQNEIEVASLNVYRRATTN